MCEDCSMDTVKELFNYDGEIVGFWDVVDWWIEKYPDDIFVENPKEVVEIRDLMIRLKRKKKP